MHNASFIIRKNRNSKGYSQDYMAQMLNISQASYARIESGTTKITIRRLYKIAEILEKKVTDFFDDEIIVDLVKEKYKEIDESTIGYKLYMENKEIYEKLLKSKDEQIELLNKLLKL